MRPSGLRNPPEWKRFNQGLGQAKTEQRKPCPFTPAQGGGPARREEEAKLPYFQVLTVNSFERQVMGKCAGNGKWRVIPLGETCWALSSMSLSPDLGAQYTVGPIAGVRNRAPTERWATRTAATVACTRHSVRYVYVDPVGLREILPDYPLL